MPSDRSNRIHGRAGYSKPDGDVQGRGQSQTKKQEIEIDRSPEGDLVRATAKIDPVFLYDEFMAGMERDEDTDELVKQKLGDFQYLMLDYLLLDMIDEIREHSPLKRHLPEKDERGRYKERWLHFRTLDKDPEIQDGPDGDVSKRFYGESGKIFQGVIIRIIGNAKTKCLLAPRNHLKSTVGNLEKMFRILRAPEQSHVIRTGVQKLAKQFLNGIKKHFDNNDHFRKYWGDLRPNKRNIQWSTEAIQLMLPPELSSNDPTLTCSGNATEMTGTHWQTGTADDVVGEKNSKTIGQLEAGRDLLGAMNAQRKGKGILHDVGTRWHDDDAHGLFIGKPGSNEWAGTMSQHSCLMVATVLDDDTSVTVAPLKNGQLVSPLGHGKPIWPEGFGLDVIEQTRASMSDYLWCGQYFNQFVGTSNKLFKKAWIRNYWRKEEDKGYVPQSAAGEYRVDGKIIVLKEEDLNVLTPKELAEKLHLNITFGNDTASGKPKQTGKLDRTAGLVIGQTQDRSRNFVLDGYRENLPAEQIAIAIVDKAVKWNKVAMSYRGTFRAGFEDNNYTNFLEPLIKHEQKKFGADALFPIECLSHANEAKWSRAEILATPHCEGLFFWPAELIVNPTRLSDEQKLHGVQPIEPYDFRVLLEAEWCSFSRNASADDIIDAFAYAYAISFPTNWKEEKKPDDVNYPHGSYSRERALEAAAEQDIGGYVPEEMERAY